eukprot:gene6331-6565_t
MSVLISVEELRKACLAAVKKKAQRERIQGIFEAPGFFVQFNQHGFYKGYDSKAGQACFLLEVQAAREIISSISNDLNVDLQLAGEAVSAAAHQHRGEHFKDEEEVDVSSVAAHQAILKSFKNLVKQQKSQALHAEVSQKLMEATELAQPAELHSTAKRGKHSNLAANRMFLSIDFEWWEKSDGVILEIGWSLWDTFTCKHRSRHWVIKENLNKANGRHISDNRNFFLFGSSDRGSLDKAFDALQTEVDQLGLTEGLTYQQIQALKASGVELVLVGHGMAQDLEQAQLFEVEWPEDMKMFDTQKLYMAWQLQQLGAPAGRKALEEVVLRAESAGAAPKSAPTIEMPSMLVGQQRKTANQPLVQAAGDDDSDTDDFHGLPVASDSDEDITDEELEQDAVAAVAEKLQGMSAGSVQRAGSAGSNGKHKGRPKGPTQVQNPPRTRPWPAGPAPAGNDCPTGLAPGAAAARRECKDTDQEIKLDHQIGLAPLLAAMGIKASRMHNAGNDARFTMEAFLALAGHEPCPDPADAHMQSTQHDDRYQQQLESSLQAARAQGWGSPLPSSSGPSPQSQGRPNSGGQGGRHGSNLSPAGTVNRPGNGAAAAGGRGRGMFAGKSDGASPAVQAPMLEGDAARVLHVLKEADGQIFLTAVGQQAHSTPQHLLGVLIPLLKLLTLEDMRDPLHSNPVLSCVFSVLDIQHVAEQLRSISREAAAPLPGFCKQLLSRATSVESSPGSLGLMPCSPEDWLDVLQPLILFLWEVVQRFRCDLMQQPGHLQGAKELWQVAVDVAARLLPADGSVAQSSKASDWRRLLAHLNFLGRQMQAQQTDSDALQRLLQMRQDQEQHSRKLQQQSFSQSRSGGPGELGAGGPRHNNDKVNHLEMSIAPTREEVLCSIIPYIPQNRPGSISHAAHDPDRAHRELHFRLLRHDLLSPITAAVQAFREFGGVAGLSRLKGRDKALTGCSVRVRLKTAREWADLYIFKNVEVLGLTNTFSGGIAYRA